MRERTGAVRLTALARAVTEELRAELSARAADGDGAAARDELLAEAARRLQREAGREGLAGVRRVINATGVVLHTNLGRAPLSEAARSAVAREAASYCTLEYDLAKGERGRRGARAEELLAELTGAEDALVVNNCAGRPCSCSRAGRCGGHRPRRQLVEIGATSASPTDGASGTTMIEVALRPPRPLRLDAPSRRTRLDPPRHPRTTASSLHGRPLARRLAASRPRRSHLFTRAGSGALIDLTPTDSATSRLPTIESGADVCVLQRRQLWARQAGLIVGRETCRTPAPGSLYRALRADTLDLAALEATLEGLPTRTATSKYPALRMLTPRARNRARAQASPKVAREGPGRARSARDRRGALGVGGVRADHAPPTALVTLSHLPAPATP